MSIMTDQMYVNEVEQQLHLHPAWQGSLAGLYAEDKLKGQAPFTYLLRSGEIDSHYYVSFVLPDGSIKHQPFLIKVTSGGWFCRNGYVVGPFLNMPFQEILHLIMHCEKSDCIPFTG